jgi:hypothetical protein
VALAWSFISYVGAVVFTSGFIMPLFGIMGAFMGGITESGPRRRDSLLLFGIGTGVGLLQCVIAWLPMRAGHGYDNLWPVTIAGLMLTVGHIFVIGGFMEHQEARRPHLLPRHPERSLSVARRWYIATAFAILAGWPIA